MELRERRAVQRQRARREMTLDREVLQVAFDVGRQHRPRGR
jgi:hypothetical protein